MKKLASGGSTSAAFVGTSSTLRELRARLLAETEKAHARVKRDLDAARKKHDQASARLSKARTALRSKATSANQKRVDELVKQVQDLTAKLASTQNASALEERVSELTEQLGRKQGEVEELRRGHKLLSDRVQEVQQAAERAVADAATAKYIWLEWRSLQDLPLS